MAKVEVVEVVGVCEGGFVGSEGVEDWAVVVVEVVGKGFSCNISNLENKTEPLRIRNPPGALVDESGRKKGVVIYFDILAVEFSFSSFKGEEIVVKLEGGVSFSCLEVVVKFEGGVYFSCSENAAEVLENDLPMNFRLVTREADVEDVEVKGVEEDVSLLVCLLRSSSFSPTPISSSNSSSSSSGLIPLDSDGVGDGFGFGCDTGGGGGGIMSGPGVGRILLLLNLRWYE